MSDGSYPRVLYRSGAQEAAHGVMVDLHFVHSDEEAADALAAGWASTPAEAAELAAPPEEPPAPLSLLDKPVKEIAEVLPQLTRDELEALKADETAGKTRKGLLTLIDAALAALEG